MNWYKVTKKRVVEQDVYVKANSAEEAAERVTNAEWDGETGEELVRSYKDGAPKKVKGIPRWLWEELGYPDDERIAS